METDSSLGNIRIILSASILTIVLALSYFYNYRQIYNHIDVDFREVAFIEYSRGSIDMSDLIYRVDGDRAVVVQGVDPTQVGTQEIILRVERDSVVREIVHEVEVKDTTPPEIHIVEEMISVYVGEEVNILDNIESVFDVVCGDLEFKEEASEEDVRFFSIDTDLDIHTAGVYDVNIIAVDSNHNKTEKTFQITIKNRPVVVPRPVVRPSVPTESHTPNSYNNYAVSQVDTSSIGNAARSLIGSPYRMGGTTRAGFDCSGFVQYVYAMMGISISRSSRTQIHDGVGVSIDHMQAGDIIIWSANGHTPTHSSLYVGGGIMVHATNPRQGVIASNVWAWNRGSRDSIIAVRRI